MDAAALVHSLVEDEDDDMSTKDFIGKNHLGMKSKTLLFQHDRDVYAIDPTNEHHVCGKNLDTATYLGSVYQDGDHGPDSEDAFTPNGKWKIDSAAKGGLANKADYDIQFDSKEEAGRHLQREYDSLVGTMRAHGLRFAEAAIPGADDDDMPTKDFVTKYDLGLRNEITGGDWRKGAVFYLSQNLGEEVEEHESLTGENEADYDVLHVRTGGGEEYMLYKNDDKLEELALQRVTDDLRNEPGNFTQDWLMHFVDKDKLRATLKDDEENSVRDMYSDDDEWLSEMLDNGKLEEENFQDADGDRVSYDTLDRERQRLVDDAKEAWIEEMVAERLDDPMQYLEDIYGDEGEVAKKVLEWGCIDIEAAAKSAVATDGAAHFMNSYDGNQIELEGGALALRSA